MRVRVENAFAWRISDFVTVLQNVETSELTSSQKMVYHYTDLVSTNMLVKYKRGLELTQDGYHGAGVYFSTEAPTGLFKPDDNRQFGEVFREFRDHQLSQTYTDINIGLLTKVDCVVLVALDDKYHNAAACKAPGALFVSCKQRIHSYFPFNFIKRVYQLVPMAEFRPSSRPTALPLDADPDEFHGLLWKQSPSKLLFGMFQRRHVQLDAGKLIWSRLGADGSSGDQRGMVDFSKNVCEVEALRDNDQRFELRPLDSKWFEATFTGSQDARTFVFDASDSGHSRDCWVAALSAHIFYGQTQARSRTVLVDGRSPSVAFEPTLTLGKALSIDASAKESSVAPSRDSVEAAQASAKSSSPSSKTASRPRPKLLRTVTRQAAGHEGEILKEGNAASTSESPTIFKKLDPNEVNNYVDFWSCPDDPLANFIPKYQGTIEQQNGLEDVDEDKEAVGSEETKTFIRLQNVIFGFRQPFVMDCKMGIRTYEESECSSQKQRKDLFDKLVKIGGSRFCTAEELEQGWITKHKWMSTRDKMSSTYELGFRIDGIAGPNSFKIKAEDFSSMNSRSSIIALLQRFLDLPFLESATLEKVRTSRNLIASLPSDNQGKKLAQASTVPLRLDGEADSERSAEPDRPQDNEWRRAGKETLGARINLAQEFVNILERLRENAERSPFFQSREFIGSSLLLAVDSTGKYGVHLIDLAKTRSLPDGLKIDHRKRWELGNHEDGFLLGVESFASCWQEVLGTLREEFEQLAETDPGCKISEAPGEALMQW